MTCLCPRGHPQICRHLGWRVLHHDGIVHSSLIRHSAHLDLQPVGQVEVLCWGAADDRGLAATRSMTNTSPGSTTPTTASATPTVTTTDTVLTVVVVPVRGEVV